MDVDRMPKQVDWAHCKSLESRLDQLTLVMTSLNKRLMGKGIGQDLEYEEESMHNLPAVA